VTGDDVAALLDVLGAEPGRMKIANFRVLGGAVARVPEHATAFAHRRCAIMVTLVGAAFDVAAPQPELDTWARSTARLLRSAATASATRIHPPRWSGCVA
jgi:hypothetical protein